MGRKETTTKKDLMTVINLLENSGIRYWVDGGWGVDILVGEQTRLHRDIDINFDAEVVKGTLQSTKERLTEDKLTPTSQISRREAAFRRKQPT